MALDFTTSAPPALPNIISPASFDAFVATLSIDDRVSSDDSTVVEWMDDDDDAILSLVVDNVRDDVTDAATFVIDGCMVVAKVILLKDDADEEEPTFLVRLLTKFDDECGRAESTSNITATNNERIILCRCNDDGSVLMLLRVVLIILVLLVEASRQI